MDFTTAAHPPAARATVSRSGWYHEVPIEDVTVPDGRRPVDPDKVRALAKTLKAQLSRSVESAKAGKIRRRGEGLDAESQLIRPSGGKRLREQSAFHGDADRTGEQHSAADLPAANGAERDHADSGQDVVPDRQPDHAPADREAEDEGADVPATDHVVLARVDRIRAAVVSEVSHLPEAALNAAADLLQQLSAEVRARTWASRQAY